MTDFIICYEHINREIENDTLLKHELEKRGYSCKIMHFNGVGFYTHSKKKNKAKVVVTPWLRYDENVYHFLKLASKSHKLVNLQWEQVYSRANVSSGICNVSGQSTKAYHICWGENSRNRLIKSGCNPDFLPITGAIQNDYGREIFKHYYLSKDEIAEQFNLDKNKRWVLLVSSFAYANYSEHGIKQQASKFGEHIYRLVSINKESQKLTLDWVEKFLSETDTEFIYRPHPSERVNSRLEEMSRKYKNFHVISDYTVKQWAKVSDNVNLWISTSNAEILSLGVDYCILRPTEIPDDLDVESMKNEEFVTNYETFRELNTKPSSSDKIAKKIENLSFYYDYDYEKPAYEKIADFLIEVLKSDKSVNYSFSFKQKISLGLSELKKKTMCRIEEKYSATGKFNFLEKIFLKEIIKKNIIKAAKTYNDASAVEKRMSDYLEKNVG